LVLNIKEGDYIKLGDDIRIEVLKDMSAGVIKIGIDAPRSTKILRSKLYESELAANPEGNQTELDELARRKQRAQEEIEDRKRKTAYYKELQRRKA